MRLFADWEPDTGFDAAKELSGYAALCDRIANDLEFAQCKPLEALGAKRCALELRKNIDLRYLRLPAFKADREALKPKE